MTRSARRRRPNTTRGIALSPAVTHSSSHPRACLLASAPERPSRRNRRDRVIDDVPIADLKRLLIHDPLRLFDVLPCRCHGLKNRHHHITLHCPHDSASSSAAAVATCLLDSRPEALRVSLTGPRRRRAALRQNARSAVARSPFSRSPPAISVRHDYAISSHSGSAGPPSFTRRGLLNACVIPIHFTLSSSIVVSSEGH